MKIGELFAGIGGLGLGASWAMPSFQRRQRWRWVNSWAVQESASEPRHKRRVCGGHEPLGGER